MIELVKYMNVLDKGGGGSREILKRHERLPSP